MHVVVRIKLLRPITAYRVQCCYKAFQFFTILHTALRWPRQNVDATLNSLKTPHTAPSWVRYGVSVVRIMEKIDHIFMALHSMHQQFQSQLFHSNNGLWLIRYQAIIRNNAASLLIRSTTYSRNFLVKIQQSQYRKLIWKFRLQNGDHFVISTNGNIRCNFKFSCLYGFRLCKFASGNDNIVLRLNPTIWIWCLADNIIGELRQIYMETNHIERIGSALITWITLKWWSEEIPW